MMLTTDQEAMLLREEVDQRSDGWPLTDSDARSIAGRHSSAAVLGAPFLSLFCWGTVDPVELRASIVGLLRGVREAGVIRDLCDLWTWSVHAQAEQAVWPANR
jgi:hypothetical protein